MMLYKVGSNATVQVQHITICY